MAIPGFYCSATVAEIEKNGFVLTPGRYVGAAHQDEKDEPFATKMERLVARLRQQQAEAARLDAAITVNLDKLGLEGNT